MKKNLLKILSICLVFVLVTAAAITFTACNEKDHGAASDTPSESVNDALKTFTLEVTFADGTVEKNECTSDAEMLGSYLTDEKIIEGEQGDYGIMILSVLGETHDYNVDKSYWAFYIDGEYAMTGVDSTPIEEGKVYSLKAEVSE